MRARHAFRAVESAMRNIRDEAGVVAKFGVRPHRFPIIWRWWATRRMAIPAWPGGARNPAAAVLARFGHLESIPVDWRTWQQ